MKKRTSLTNYRTILRQFTTQAGALSRLDWGPYVYPMTTTRVETQRVPSANDGFLLEEASPNASSLDVQKAWQEGQLESMRSHIA